MKKIFFTLLLTVGIVTSYSQTVALRPEVEAFLLQQFPKHMPAYVLAHVDTVAVIEADTKKKVQMVNLNNGSSFEDNLRIGDTVLVFEGKKFYSLKRNLFIACAEKQKQKKEKRHRYSAAQKIRKPLDPRIIQVGTQMGQQVLTGIIWRVQTQGRF